MRVMDGSEPGENGAAAVLSGAPTDLQARTVRYVANPTLHPIQQLIYHPESIARLRRLHNLVTGMDTTGAWIGMCCKRDTDGRTL